MSRCQATGKEGNRAAGSQVGRCITRPAPTAKELIFYIASDAAHIVVHESPPGPQIGPCCDGEMVEWSYVVKGLSHRCLIADIQGHLFEISQIPTFLRRGDTPTCDRHGRTRCILRGRNSTANSC